VTVLDSSAILALLHNEPGADLVAARIPGSVVGAANLAEVIGKVIDLHGDQKELQRLFERSGVVVEPVTQADAEFAGAIRSLPGGRSLSLGDRCCLALAVRTQPPSVLTGDRAWKKLNLPITVELIR